jgi:hypothetical protein
MLMKLSPFFTARAPMMMSSGGRFNTGGAGSGRSSSMRNTPVKSRSMASAGFGGGCVYMVGFSYPEVLRPGRANIATGVASHSFRMTSSAGNRYRTAHDAGRR